MLTSQLKLCCSCGNIPSAVLTFDFRCLHFSKSRRECVKKLFETFLPGTPSDGSVSSTLTSLFIKLSNPLTRGLPLVYFEGCSWCTRARFCSLIINRRMEKNLHQSPSQFHRVLELLTRVQLRFKTEEIRTIKHCKILPWGENTNSRQTVVTLYRATLILAPLENKLFGYSHQLETFSCR